MGGSSPHLTVFSKSLSFAVATLFHLICVPSAEAQKPEATLKETLSSAQAALSAGDYGRAASCFGAIQTTFSEESEVQEESFQVVVMPLHAYATLLIGDTGGAIRLFEDFLARFPEDRSRLAFVLFNLARAYETSGEFQDSIDTYRRFVALDPRRPEAALATLSAAELMFESGQTRDGFETLNVLIEQQPEGVIRSKARLSALQQALDLGETSLARNYLLGERWSVTDMPELAVLAFSAMQIGQSLLEKGKYTDAIECYRMVPPYAKLIESQRARLTETTARFKTRKQSIGLYQEGQFWTQFYKSLIERLEQQLEALTASEDYSPALYLSYGQAYLLAGRTHEAWILFETLARNEALYEATQAEAHYRWILAAIQIGVWEDAFRIAEGFGERFPESHLVPDALYLLATAHQEARQYRDAIKVLDTFLENYDEHRLAPRVLFVRGYNQNLLNEPALARQDFESFMQRHPQHGLYHDAQFWRALTFFAEKDYPQTLEALHAIEADIKGHRLEPEIAYRISSVLYSQKDYDSALKSIQSYLNHYPYHTRHQEGRVLLGDIEMGRGELTKARNIFASIQPTAGHLFAYALFQTGKILRTVAGAEDRADTRASTLDSHLKHFTHYVERADIPFSRKERISEALYWIGWTHLKKSDPDSARQVFIDALEQYGDDIEAEQVSNIIEALSQIDKRVADSSKKERTEALKQWITDEKGAAKQADRLTYFARLNFYLESLLPDDATTSLIFETVETVPLERIDPEGLGKIASRLVKSYPNVTKDFLERLEDEYPDSRHRTYGYYARAVLDFQEEDYLSARTELARFRAESPMHPLGIPVALLYARSLTASERFKDARETLEEILTMRHAKGRPHAEALIALSQNAAAEGRLERAIPYAQRVYNVYRAYPDLSAKAYWISANQFEAIGDHVAAYKTLDEMLSDPRIRARPIFEEADAKRTLLFESLPERALDEPSPEDEVAETTIRTKQLP